MTAVHPSYLPRRHMREAAEDHGFNPTPDDLTPPAQHLLPGEGVDPLTAFAACVEAARINNERTWA